MTHWRLCNISSISEELKSGLGCRFCKRTQYVVRLMLILIHYLQHSFCAQKQKNRTASFSKAPKKPKTKKNKNEPSAKNVVANSYYNH